MDDEKKGIDVFEDGDLVKEPEIFKTYPDSKNSGYIPKATAITIIVAVILVILLIGGSFAGGYFTAKSNGIEGDMPMLEKAYELVKKYYYKDISWDEFQILATQGMLEEIDDFTFLSNYETEMVKKSIGVNILTNNYCEYTIARISPDSPLQTLYAKSRCEGPAYTQGASYKSVTYASTENVEAEQIKIQRGDRLIALSISDTTPIVVNGLKREIVNALIAQSDNLDLYIQRSNGYGEFTEDCVYKFEVEKTYQHTNYANLFTPEEIGDSTGTTAMIEFAAFSKISVVQFYDCLQRFVEGGYKHLILDLRENGGGDEEVIQFLAACFIEGAKDADIPLVYVKSKQPNGKTGTRYMYSSRQVVGESEDGEVTLNAINLPSQVEDFKMTILCNGGSASASEVIIGALSYYEDVKIVGRKTYGKGVGQACFVLNSKYLLYITNSEYFIPTDIDGDGKVEWTESIHGIGFKPDTENTVTGTYAPLDKDLAVQRALTILNS